MRGRTGEERRARGRREGPRRGADGERRGRSDGGGAPRRARPRPGQGCEGPGGSFLEERCHLKDAADRDAREGRGFSVCSGLAGVFHPRAGVPWSRERPLKAQEPRPSPGFASAGGSPLKTGPRAESEGASSSPLSPHPAPAPLGSRSPAQGGQRLTSVYPKSATLTLAVDEAGRSWLSPSSSALPQASLLPCPGADKRLLHRQLPSAVVLGSRKTDFY